MARPSVVTCMAAIFCLASSACEEDAALFAAGPIDVPEAEEEADPTEPAVTIPPVNGIGIPPVVPPGAPIGTAPPTNPAVQPSGTDAGVVTPAEPDEPDAGPPPAAPSPIVNDGPVAALPRLGVDGGQPRLGGCAGGVIIGVRTTANPSEEVFGQRLTFVEPICGKALHQPDAPASSSIRVTRDDSIVAWSTADGFLGLPPTEVPDPRLTWVLQPETLCPEATPVVVGLSGEYDPVAPDVVDTAAIRSLFIECAPLVVASNGIGVAAAEAGHQLISNADSFAVSGTTMYRSVCEGGAVITQVLVHAGFWLDGFVLGCSRLRVE